MKERKKQVNKERKKERNKHKKFEGKYWQKKKIREK